MENSESEREVFMHANYLQNSIKETEEQLQLVNRQIAELGEFRTGLQSFISSDKKEMLSSLGKGVFVKTDLKEKGLFVDVGAGVLVKKTPEETLRAVEEQILRLSDMRVSLSAQFDSQVRELQALVARIEAHRANSRK
jgi:prefoldin alpha subunit